VLKAETKLTQAQENLQNAALVAPITGTVTAVTIKAGTGIGRRILRIAKAPSSSPIWTSPRCTFTSKSPIWTRSRWATREHDVRGFRRPRFYRQESCACPPRSSEKATRKPWKYTRVWILLSAHRLPIGHVGPSHGDCKRDPQRSAGAAGSPARAGCRPVRGLCRQGRRRARAANGASRSQGFGPCRNHLRRRAGRGGQPGRPDGYSNNPDHDPIQPLQPTARHGPRRVLCRPSPGGPGGP